MFVGGQQYDFRAAILDGPTVQCKIKQQVRYQHQSEFIDGRPLKVSAGLHPQLPDLFGKVLSGMKCTSEPSAKEN